MSEIVILGSLNMDLVVKSSRIPGAGETLSGEEFQTIPGGKGANQAAAITRLGGEVAMVGRVGRDAFGEKLTQNLEVMGVDAGHIRVDTQTSTGVALIIVEASGENRIIIIPGANGKMDSSDVQSAANLIRNARLLILQLEIPLETVTEAIVLAHQYSIPILLNPAPAYPLSDEILSKVTYLILNETEARMLTSQPVTNQASAEQAAKTLLTHGVQVVVLTLGAQGALLSTSQGTTMIPAFPVKAVDTTAAGDAFIGGFAVSLLRGKNLPENVRYGNAAGGLAATKFGAQTSLPIRDAVERLLAGR
ncbi:MAG: ribokinase [Anaerolineaceae bacterium]|nr:ribokinase [Anaerolineaceae bacterium]